MTRDRLSVSYPETYYSARLPADDTRWPRLEGVVEADICIVGGGLAGVTLALLLAERGASCVLLESERIGWGASGRNGGFVSAGFAQSVDVLERKLGLDHARALYTESAAGADFVKQRASALENGRRGAIIQGYGRLKLLRHKSPGTLERQAEHMNTHYGRQFSTLSNTQLQSALTSTRYHHGLSDPDTFAIDPLAYLRGLAKGLPPTQGQSYIYENSRVEILDQHGSGWRLSTQHGTVNARQVVLTGSAYLGKAYPKLARAVLPVATYVVTTRPLKQKLTRAIRARACISDSRLASDYYRRIDADRLLWGGRITTQRSEPAHLAEGLKQQILDIYPQLEGLEIDQAWSGLMGYAVHKMPIIGEIEPGLWSCTAFGGHGLATTAMGAQILADSLTGKDDRHRLFDPFRIRWGGGALGRAGTQLIYWGMRLQDSWRERRAG